jgi:hypothetical protein
MFRDARILEDGVGVRRDDLVVFALDHDVAHTGDDRITGAIQLPYEGGSLFLFG